MNELLVRAAAGIAQGILANIKVLAAGGLDEGLAERFLSLLKDITSDGSTYKEKVKD